jgi:phosphatidylserine decarboxylase
MTITRTLRKILATEDINFLVTNRIPRQSLTLLMGRVSHIQSAWFTRLALKVWGWFDDFDMHESASQHFDSIHAFFIRALKPGMRPIASEPNTLVSPCDGVIGAHGPIEDGQLFQAKGFPYTLQDLLGPDAEWDAWRHGYFVTLRIRASMYHRFHAPCTGRLRRVHYFSGDTWNVNPIALQRVEKLFCKNERAALWVENTEQQHTIALVPVAAVLVASIRLHAIDTLMHLRYQGPRRMDCDHPFARGDEMGWFQHGSTIVMLMPPGYGIAPGRHTDDVVRVGQTLLTYQRP